MENIKFSKSVLLITFIISCLFAAVCSADINSAEIGTADAVKIASSEKAAAETVEPLSQCADLVKRCFAGSDAERSNCFYTSARHPFCEGTSLGSLTMKRFAMAPDRPAGDEAPGFLGPKLVDRECLNNFDSSWSGQLVNGGLNTKMMQQLDESLDKCQREISIELTRP